MNFLFACGGTAGHINPAIAVAGRLKELMPESKFLFVGAKGKMEEDLVPRAGYEIELIEITNIQRSLSPAGIKHNLKTALNVVKSLGASKRIIRDFKPDVVHIFGTEFPHALACARAYRRPSRILIGIQGLISACADVYMADLPRNIQHKVTFRDFSESL